VVNRSRRSVLQHFDAASLLWGQEIIGQIQLLVVANATAGSSWLSSAAGCFAYSFELPVNVWPNE